MHHAMTIETTKTAKVIIMAQRIFPNLWLHMSRTRIAQVHLVVSIVLTGNVSLTMSTLLNMLFLSVNKIHSILGLIRI